MVDSMELERLFRTMGYQQKLVERERHDFEYAVFERDGKNKNEND